MSFNYASTVDRYKVLSETSISWFRISKVNFYGYNFKGPQKANLQVSLKDMADIKAKITKSLIGHKDRVFDLRFNSINNLLISGSEDGTCKVWDFQKSRCCSTVTHNVNAEVLRVSFIDNGGLCTAGSDGNAILWSSDSEFPSRKFKKMHVLEHGNESQIYVCEAKANNSELVTAADSMLVVWDLEKLQAANVLSFTKLQSSDGDQAFGGPRNPDNEVYVFDAKVNPVQHHIIAATLSDATVRMVDTRIASTSSSDASGGPAISCVSLSQQNTFNSDKLGHATAVC
jgi:WD40 repeat protein